MHILERAAVILLHVIRYIYQPMKARVACVTKKWSYAYIDTNLDLTMCQGTGKLVRYIEGLLNRKPRYNEFVEKQPKCSLYRGIVNNCFVTVLCRTT